MLMDLVIETLTGVFFELQVSPTETVMSVKSKIQRAEGIPVAQQHLIWQNDELDDHRRLRDYSIAGGSTIRLVLGMRGGPLNAHRVPPLRLAPIQLPPSTSAILPKFTRFPPSRGRILHLPRSTLPSLASLRSLAKSLDEPTCPDPSSDADGEKVFDGAIKDGHSTASPQSTVEKLADAKFDASDRVSTKTSTISSHESLSSESKKLESTFPARLTNDCIETRYASEERRLTPAVSSSTVTTEIPSIVECDQSRLATAVPENSVSVPSVCEKDSQVPASDHCSGGISPPPGYPPLLPSRAFRRSYNHLDVSAHWRLYDHQGLSALSGSFLVRSPFAICGSAEQDSDNSPPATASSRDSQPEGAAALELTGEDYTFPSKTSSAAATVLAGILSSASDCFGPTYQTSGSERLLDHPPYPFHWLRRPPRLTEDSSLPPPFVPSSAFWDSDGTEELDALPGNLLELEGFDDDPDEDDDDSIEGKGAYNCSLDDDDSLADLEDYLFYYRTGDLLFGPPSLTTNCSPYSYYTLRDPCPPDLEADFGVYSTRAVGDTSIKHHSGSSWRQEYAQLSEKVNDLKTRMRDLRLRRQRRQKSQTMEHEAPEAQEEKPQLNAISCTVSPARDTPINAPCGAVEHCDPTHACPSNANSVESQQDTDTHCTQSAPRCSTPRSSEKKPSSRRRERRFATVTPPELSTLMQSTNVDNRIGPALPHTSVIASAVKTSKIIRASMPLISESLAYQANERRPMSSVTASSLPSGFLTASRQSNCTPPVIDTQSHIPSNSFSDPTQVSNRPHTSATPVCSVAKTHSTLKGLPWLSPKSIQLLANQSSVLTNSSGVSREASTSTLLPLSRSLPPKDNELLAPLSSQKPVSPPKPGRRKRCSLCLRKTGLVGGYSCRCGRNFCFRHRYAELHACPFDYKAEARRTLIDSNPVVTAPKLPKI